MLSLLLILFWEINKIEIYNEQNNEPSKEDKILNFSNNDQLFSIIKNNNLYKLLNRSLIKNKNFKKIKIKNKSFYFNIFKIKNMIYLLIVMKEI